MRRLLTGILAVLILFCWCGPVLTAAAAKATVKPTAKPTSKTAVKPTSKPTGKTTTNTTYSVTIDVANQVVDVYKVSGGSYVRIKRFICSTSLRDNFKYGTYRMNGQKLKWTTAFDFKHQLMYFTRIVGHFGFHAVPYMKRSNNALDLREYRRLGSRASAGCIRLLARDAKWIFDNIPARTTIKMTRGTYDANVKYSVSAPGLIAKYGGWDPTDPAAGNPYR